MADVKFTGLPAGSGIPDNGSLCAISTFDGASTYVSEKYTMTQLKDIVYVMEAEDKISFVSTGTNKIFVQDSTNTGNKIVFDSVASSDYIGIYSDAISYAEIQGGGVTNYSKGWVYVDSTSAAIGGNNNTFYTTLTDTYAEHAGTDVMRANSSGTSFSRTGGFGSAFLANSSGTAINYDGTTRVLADTTGLGFFGATPVAKPTSVAVSAAGIHAALTSLGLIS